MTLVNNSTSINSFLKKFSNLRPTFLILFLAIVIYIPTLWFGFSPMDETWLIRDYREDLSQMVNLPKLFTNSTAGMYYRPVWTSSIMFDLVLGKGSPIMFHLTNILLHAICCVLLFRIFLILEVEKQLSLWCAIIFAVHPLNVHAVAWIPGRNDTLLCAFALVSIYFFVNYFKTNSILSLMMHYVGFCLALLTKENAIVLPALYGMLLLLKWKQSKAKQIFLLVSSWLLLGVGWFFLRKSIVNFLPSSGESHFVDAMQNFLSAIIIYIGKCAVPFQQAIMPMVQNTSLIPGILIIITIAVLSMKCGFKNKRTAAFGIVWFFIFITIPTWVGATNAIGEHYEHRAYASLIGFILLVSQINIVLSKRVVVLLSVIVICLFSIKTFYRSQLYKNELSFVTNAIKESPHVALLQNIAGLEYVKVKDYRSAAQYFTKAIELKPGKGEYYNNRGGCYLHLKDFMNALADYNKTVELMPTNGKAYLNRSMIHYSLGNIYLAVNDLEQASQLKTNEISGDYINVLNNAFQNEVIKSYSDSINKNPQYAINYNIRGVAYFNLKDISKALFDYNKAIDLDPSNKEFIYNRYMLYTYIKDDKMALSDKQVLTRLQVNLQQKSN